MRGNKILLAVLAIVVSGCAATTPRGVVAMKVSSDEAHVCLGNEEGKEGDLVLLYINDCKVHRSRYRTSKPVSRTCKKIYKGRGIITKNLNEHYSVVQFQDGVEFAEGDVIEIQKKKRAE